MFHLTLLLIFNLRTSNETVESAPVPVWPALSCHPCINYIYILSRENKGVLLILSVLLKHFKAYLISLSLSSHVFIYKV